MSGYDPVEGSTAIRSGPPSAARPSPICTRSTPMSTRASSPAPKIPWPSGWKMPMSAGMVSPWPLQCPVRAFWASTPACFHPGPRQGGLDSRRSGLSRRAKRIPLHPPCRSERSGQRRPLLCQLPSVGPHRPHQPLMMNHLRSLLAVVAILPPGSQQAPSREYDPTSVGARAGMTLSRMEFSPLSTRRCSRARRWLSPPVISRRRSSA